MLQIPLLTKTQSKLSVSTSKALLFRHGDNSIVTGFFPKWTFEFLCIKDLNAD